ncbi:hypothetical protein FPQ18DRAFT_391478 [Pyronema domesticum]|nr:hypothetical protein FPQ18DRAFT_391478 [Pyronema domesticum]
MIALLAWGLLLCQVQAALISTFDNCLPTSVQKSPRRLQWHPVLVAAEWNSADRFLTVTSWGTVTGESNTVPDIKRRSLDVPNKPLKGSQASRNDERKIMHRQTDSSLVDWSVIERESPPVDIVLASAMNYNNFKVDGRLPSKDIAYNYTASITDGMGAWPYATKFTVRGTLASYSVTKFDSFFCKDLGAKCPFGNRISMNVNATSSDPAVQMFYRLGPEDQRNNVSYLVQELPSFTWTRLLPQDYQFSSLGFNFRIVAGNQEATTIGCVNVEITPEFHSGYAGAVRWFVAATLMFVGVVVILASIFNPWTGTNDLFKFSSNYGMDPDMLRMVTPGFADCLQWIQFIVLTGALTLNYPGFYQPVVSNGAWSILMTNWSIYTKEGQNETIYPWKGDGIYTPQMWKEGYERLSQAVGLFSANDILPGVLMWFAIIFAACVVAFQIWFFARWAFWKLTGTEQGDLTDKNLPFTFGLLCRFTATYFLLPLVTACIFQLTVAYRSPTALTIIGCIVLGVLLIFLPIVCFKIWNHEPRSELFDDIPTLLKYGTFYNTHRETQLRYFIVPIGINLIRGIAFGGIQASGITQIVILAACEVMMMLAIYGMKPYAKETWMNLWHFVFAMVRLLTLLLMLAFAPQINASDAIKTWIGWIILGIHGLILVLFALKALQVSVELAVRPLIGDEEAARGGFAKVFGVRQLSRRKRHSKPDPHGRSSSPPSDPPVLLGTPVIDTAPVDPSTSLSAGYAPSTPSTPGRVSGYGYLPPVDTSAGPYYRPPRTRRIDSGDQSTMTTPAGYGHQSRGSWASDAYRNPRSSQNSLPLHHGPGVAPSNLSPLGAAGFEFPGPSGVNDDWEGGRGTPTTAHGNRYTDSATTLPSGGGINRTNPPTDYAVREVDFYYGVRGPALSQQPQRRLGTGPADPTGHVANARMWIRSKLGLGKGGLGKEKGFSVVRSSRMPKELVAAEGGETAMSGAGSGGGGGMTETGRASAIGMAVTTEQKQEQEPRSPGSGSDTSSDAGSIASDTSSEDGAAGPSQRMLEKRPEQGQAGQIELKPTVPRKSSKRRSRDTPQLQSPLSPLSPLYDPPITRIPSGSYHPDNRLSTSTRESTSRMPFIADNNDPEHSMSFSTINSELEPPELVGEYERPGSTESFGRVGRGRGVVVVQQEELGMGGSQAELVRTGSDGSRRSAEERLDGGGNGDMTRREADREDRA